jgi:hypothetical protein
MSKSGAQLCVKPYFYAVVSPPVRLDPAGAGAA